MAGDDGGLRPGTSPVEAGKSAYGRLLDVVMRGLAIMVPLVVTLYIFSIAIDFVLGALSPFIDLLRYFGLIERFERAELVRFLVEVNLYPYVVDFLAELVALLVLFVLVLIVGSIGHNRYGERIISVVDLLLASIPGVGTLYKSFRRMGDVMLDGDSDNFRDVKLVQCLDEDMYVIGFETSAAPESVEDATTNEDMVTLFVPMAPNPVTGGFLTYVPTERVYDVDMTVEDGVKSILTSGVATGKGAADSTQLSLDDVRTVAQVDRLQDAFPGRQVPGGTSAEGDADEDGSEDVDAAE